MDEFGKAFVKNAAIYLEDIGISGDTMIQCDIAEHKGWMNLHDIMAGFTEEARQESAKQKDAEIAHLKEIIENLEMSAASFVDSRVDVVKQERIEGLVGTAYERGDANGRMVERDRIEALLRGKALKAWRPDELRFRLSQIYSELADLIKQD